MTAQPVHTTDSYQKEMSGRSVVYCVVHICLAGGDAANWRQQRGVGNI